MPSPSRNRIGLLKRFWTSWRRFGQWMGDRIARLVLSVFYFTIAMPFGLIVKLTQDPLHVKDASPAWLKREGHDDGLEQARRMF